MDGEALNAATLDAATGDALAVQRVENADLPYYGVSLPATFGATAADFYVASGNAVRYVALDTGSSASASLPLATATSLAYESGTLVVASFDASAEDLQSIPFAVAAFGTTADTTSPALIQIWGTSGTYSFSLTSNGSDGDSTDVVAADSAPRTRTVISLGKPAITCTAGSHARVCNLSNGKELFNADASSTVVGAGAMASGDNHGDLLPVICADGSLTMEDPANRYGGYLFDGADLDFPCRLTDARFLWTANSCYLALGQSADRPNRIVAYRIASNDEFEDADEIDYSTEELVAKGEDALANAGQE